MSKKNRKKRNYKIIIAITVTIVIFAAIIVNSKLGEKQYLEQKIYQVANDTLRLLGMGVQEITITGNKNITKDEIIKAINIKKTHNRFNFNLKQAYSKIVQIPGILRATLYWRMPNLIYIDIVEAKIVALFLEKNGTYSLLTQNRQTIKNAPLEQYRHLPIVRGENAQKHAPKFINILKTKPYIYALTHKIDRIGGKRWNIILKNDILIMLPENNIKYALKTIEKLEKQNQILQKPFARIDLRVKGRVAVLPKNQKLFKYY